MRHAQQGKLRVDILVMLVVLVFCLAFFGLLLFHRSHPPYREVQLRAQINALNVALELFANEFDSYPPSDANDPTGRPYCGAMKLTEALMGQDLRGFHTKSAYRADGRDPNDLKQLYPPEPDGANLRLRKGPFLQAENANVWRLVDIYGKGNTGPFPESTSILCDVYGQKRPSGQKTGMPILYYRADPSGTLHDVHNPDNLRNLYHYQDNQALLSLGVPGKPGASHPLADPKRFYLNTQDRKNSSKFAPYRPDSFILISAGPDGLYGTADDLCNFDWKYRER
jgi:hypothetical protein